LRFRRIHQTHVRLMHEGRRLQRLCGLFAGHLCGRKSPKLIVQQRQQPLGGGRVAKLDLRLDLRDVVHRNRMLGP
jgi:hypothetical protein